MKLLIADDEIDVREGIRYLLNWETLGFEICGEAKNGIDTLQKIQALQPDIVLMDIRMPRLSGLEVIKRAKDNGFAGKFIILSGYSDFSYAQQAVRYNVNFYLTKPIDEDELADAVDKTKQELLKEQNMQNKMVSYRSKARNTIVKDIICQNIDLTSAEVRELFLESSIYQVIIYTKYNKQTTQNKWDFAEILRLVNHRHNALESIVLDGQNVILLKGELALERFQNLLDHYAWQPQKGSPLDMLFLAYGNPVTTLEDIHFSYNCAKELMTRRFFCKNGEHTIGYQSLLPDNKETISMSSIVDHYPQRLANYLQTGNHEMVQIALDEMAKEIQQTGMDENSVRHYLADIMIAVKMALANLYSGKNIDLINNVAIINTIEEKSYLYEIIDFFSAQFNLYMKVIGTPSHKGIMDSILQYIQHNYQKNLKLNMIADLFGYNSSYLGQAFIKATGFTFNSYVDKVRIDAAKRLLQDNNYKVYEISDLVGYSNVNYFHKKFKKYTGISPAEYRKRSQS